MIPKKLHRIWLDEPIPERYEQFWQGLSELHPDWELITWNDSNKLDWLRCRDVFDAVTSHAGRADVLRYEIIAKYGGVYVDTDVEGLKPFDPLLDDDRAFIAWENTELLCPTVIGAPPNHAALNALLDELPDWFAHNKRKPPNEQTGPVFITKQWRRRDDVRRLPPVAFYPVGWWEKKRLGGPYPARSYAVHHWDKGWAAEEKKTVRSPKGSTRVEPHVVTLVPWRSGDKQRESNWKHVREHLEKLSYPIFTGDSDGDWNRAAAINAAALKAGQWDVAVIADADTFDDLPAVQKAVDAVKLHRGAIVPWAVRHKLSKEGTKEWLSSRTVERSMLDAEDKTPKRLPVFNRGGTIVVHRETWNNAGGFDEGFTEWGFEDVAFRDVVATLGPGRLAEIAAECVHLWHPSARMQSGNGRERYDKYRRCRKNPERMKQLLRELR